MSSTQDLLSALQFHEYVLTSECSFSFQRASLHARPLSPELSMAAPSKTHIFIFPSVRDKERMNTVLAPGVLSISSLHVHRPMSLDHSLQVNLKCRSIMISKCISEATQTTPPSVSPNALEYRLQMHLQTCLITVSKCIS